MRPSPMKDRDPPPRKLQGRVQIPKAKIRALHENGQTQDRALTDADGIHVAAVIARRAARHRLASRSHADDPDHGIQGEFHAHKSEMPIGYGTDARVPLHPIWQGSSARRGHERPGLLRADGPDMHAEHVAGFRPFHHDRAGGRVHMRKIEPGFRLPILGHLPVETIAGLHGQRTGCRHRRDGFGDAQTVDVTLTSNAHSFSSKTPRKRRPPAEKSVRRPQTSVPRTETVTSCSSWT